MSHGLLWLPLLVAFVVLTALGWLERRRQRLFLEWASESELSKLDGGGALASKTLAGGAVLKPENSSWRVVLRFASACCWP